MLVFPVMYLNESVLIDEESAKKLYAVVTEANVIVNIPFIVISVGILLGVIFIVFMCRQQMPPSTEAERQPLLSS
ncbi:lysosome membrane protein 2-like [Sinocyclocheilus rhinocerous]|uniref:lysosome membrane protein 2-like n=1 Tax=Sinocyclocheilus rhinocerous TaxID=307959 RepID=UPI0007BAC24F|nr:PREDICTED: lysosome membrane protein 2-like [Sinocyclocheilus rhinocerous]